MVDHQVAPSCVLEQDTLTPQSTARLIPRKLWLRPDVTEKKMLTGTLNPNTNKQVYRSHIVMSNCIFIYLRQSAMVSMVWLADHMMHSF